MVPLVSVCCGFSLQRTQQEQDQKGVLSQGKLSGRHTGAPVCTVSVMGEEVYELVSLQSEIREI